MRVGDIASSRSGDKGQTLDVTVVVGDLERYADVAEFLTLETVRRAYDGVIDGPIHRYELPTLGALKFVFPEALGGGVFSSLHAGTHWQKATASVLLDLEMT